jgi:EmrB/QacA subfamily drug resistance transporter
VTPQQRRVLVVAILASFVVILDGSVVNLALPAINRELGGGLSAQQWIVDAYLLTLGALILVAGSLSDLFGRARILQWGLLGFTATSVVCGLATSSGQLIAARSLQGVAGALLVPSSLALIMDAFQGRAQGKAIGQWTAWTAVAVLVAPLVGGAAVDLASWRLVFLFNLLPAAVCWPLLRGLVPEGLRRPPAQVDWGGAALAVIGLGGTVFALIEQGPLGWSSPLVLVPLVLGILALIGFVVHERRTPAPMMPPALFAGRNFPVGNIATLLIYGAMSLGFFVLALYLQMVAGWSATLAGIALLPPTALLLVASSRFGALAGRFGPRFFMAAGPAVGAGGFLLLLLVRPPVDYWWQVLPGLLVFGLGLAMTVAPLTSAILGAVDPERSGVGSAVNNAVARVAGLVTIALAGLVVGGELTTQGLHRSMAVTAGLLLLGAAVSGVGISNAEGLERSRKGGTERIG